MNNPGSTAAPYGGLCWRESSSGKLSLFAIIRNNAAPYLNGIALYKFNTATSYSGAAYSPLFTEAVWTNDLYWVKMQDNATDRIFSISVDGENWHVHHTVGRTDFLTADEWGIFANSNNSDVGVQLVSWSET